MPRRSIGFPLTLGVVLLVLVLALAVGWATLESNGSDELEPDERVQERRRLLELRFAAVSRTRRPNVVGSARELASASLSAKLFDRGLERYLSSLQPQREVSDDH